MNVKPELKCETACVGPAKPKGDTLEWGAYDDAEN